MDDSHIQEVRDKNKKNLALDARTQVAVENPSIELKQGTKRCEEECRVEYPIKCEGTGRSSSCSQSESEKDLPKKRRRIVHKKHQRASASMQNLSSSSDKSSDEDLFVYDFPADKWNLKYLERINISYENNSEVFETFVKSVQDKYGVEEYSQVVSKFTKLLNENVAFSVDFDQLYQKKCKRNTVYREKEIFEELRKDHKKLDAIIRSPLTSAGVLEASWYKAVELFIRSVMQLLKIKVDEVLEGVVMEEDDKEELQQNGPNEAFFEFLWKRFGELFFLEPCPCTKKTMKILNRTVSSMPEFSYKRFDSIPVDSLSIDDTSTVFSVIQVKERTIKDDPDISLEERLGPTILGQFGVELLKDAADSVFSPYSLGIVCIGTKFIFAFLKMPKEHLTGISHLTRKPLQTEGRIHYTRLFDMLNVEDRAEISNFMFWLGCIQNFERLCRIQEEDGKN